MAQDVIYKRTVPMIITFMAGIVMMIQYYLPAWNMLGDLFLSWFNILAAVAFVLGAGSLFVVNGKVIQRRGRDWQYKAVLLASLVLTLWAGLIMRYTREAGLWGWMNPTILPTDEGTLFDFLFQYVYTPLGATMFSLLAFFIASAAFRAFRARSIEATLLLGTAFIVMIFRVPLGEVLWNHVPWLGQWNITRLIEDFLMNGFNAAGQRAVLLGASIGLISVSLKIMLGVERSYLGGD
ncbi:MAG: hypothetical protein AB1758_04335 [Candidatus Eremiobacterota bacterium]